MEGNEEQRRTEARNFAVDMLRFLVQSGGINIAKFAEEVNDRKGGIIIPDTGGFDPAKFIKEAEKVTKNISAFLKIWCDAYLELCK